MDIRKISEVIQIIKKSGYEAFLVGGSSRDFVFYRDFKDIDIATNAPVNFIKSKFEVTDEKGKVFGSVKINYKNLEMEITTFREEVYEDGATYPKITKFLKDAEEDACRRDFTINAIYLDLTTNEVIDPYNGLKDLMDYRLAFIGEPNTRIKEDPTRIYRGLRFAYKMNLEIEPKTLQAFKENILEVKRLKESRIKKEIEKMINDLGEEKTKKILKEFQLEVTNESN